MMAEIARKRIPEYPDSVAYKGPKYEIIGKMIKYFKFLKIVI
jgi:hypothetical protein